MPLALHLPLLLSLLAHGPSLAPAKLAVAFRTVSACHAATKNDVEQALGMIVGNGVEWKGKTESSCDYVGEGGQVTITVHNSAVRLNLPAEIEALKAAIPDSQVREAPEMGVQAFFLDIPRAGTQLFVIRGDYDFLLVSVLGFGNAEKVSEAAQTIARKALNRL